MEHEGSALTRTWPIDAGVATGAVLTVGVAVVRHHAGRPAFSFLPILVVGGCAVGGIAADGDPGHEEGTEAVTVPADHRR